MSDQPAANAATENEANGFVDMLESIRVTIAEWADALGGVFGGNSALAIAVVASILFAIISVRFPKFAAVPFAWAITEAFFQYTTGDPAYTEVLAVVQNLLSGMDPVYVLTRGAFVEVVVVFVIALVAYMALRGGLGLLLSKKKDQEVQKSVQEKSEPESSDDGSENEPTSESSGDKPENDAKPENSGDESKSEPKPDPQA